MVPAPLPNGVASPPQGGTDDWAGFYDRTAAIAYGLALRIAARPEAAQAALVEAYPESASWHGPECERLERLLVRVRRCALARRHPDVRGASLSAAVERDGIVAMHRPSKSAAVVQEALSRLEPVDQVLLGLAYWEGRSVAAMAAHTGLAEIEVRRRLRDALARVSGAQRQRWEASR